MLAIDAARRQRETVIDQATSRHRPTRGPDYIRTLASCTFDVRAEGERKNELKKTSPEISDLNSFDVDHGPRPQGGKYAYGLPEILWAVAVVTNVPLIWIKSARRSVALVEARMVYYHIARNNNLASLPLIAKMCGDRHHTTVIHGLKDIADRMDEFRGWIREVEDLLARRPLEERPPPPAPDEVHHAHL